MAEKEYNITHHIGFNPLKVCTYHIHTETRDEDTNLILTQSEKKYSINPNHDFNLVSVPDEVREECDREWTQEVKDAWIKRSIEYSTMSPIERVEAGYK